MIKVELIYFKPSGKYYASGEYESFKEHMFEIFDEVKDLARLRTLPGLFPGSYGYTVLVNKTDHLQSYPALIYDNED